MSGSGGGGGGGAGGPTGGSWAPPDSQIDCANLRFETPLSSPNPTVVAQIAVGEVADVELVNPQPDVTVVGVLRRNPPQDVIGTITTRLRELLRCIQGGTDYQAEILEISGGVVRVKVEPR